MGGWFFLDFTLSGLMIPGAFSLVPVGLFDGTASSDRI